MSFTGRIELIDGRILVSGIAGRSFQLLKTLLESWTAHAALAFVVRDFEPWFEALSAHFGISLEEIEKLIAEVEVEPLQGFLNSAELISEDWHSVQRFQTNLLMSANQSNLRFANGEGFAVKLGENVLTPDFVIAQAHADLRFSERHLEGVPEIVVETVLPDKDLLGLQRTYAEHGIPEVWVVDLKRHEFVVLQNCGGYYKPTSLLTGGVYHSVAVSGLVLNIDLIWDEELSPEKMLAAVLLEENGEKYNSIINYSRTPDHRMTLKNRSKVCPGKFLFKPRIGIDPEKITFKEFISWVPKPEFGMRDNRLLIPDRTGSRNMLGILLQNFGLKKAVSVLSLEDWIIAIAERCLQIDSNLHIKKFLASEAKRTAQILRKEFGKNDLRTFGWFDQPPGMWTNVKIVDMEPENGGPPIQEISRSLRERCDTGIEFVGIESLTPGEKTLLEKRSLVL